MSLRGSGLWREAVVAHAGEALAERRAFEVLTRRDQDAVLEFLTSMQALPAGTVDRVVDEHYRPKLWPPARLPVEDATR